jgi:N-acyl-D-aspartate/D-glutamate deacylase
VISHHKCAGRANWGRSAETLAPIQQAAQRQKVGLEISAELRASSTGGKITPRLTAANEQQPFAWE